MWENMIWPKPFLVIRDNDAIAIVVNGDNADPWRWRQSNVFNWTDDLLTDLTVN